MGFVTGMIVGGMIAHHNAPSAANQQPPQQPPMTMCALAENFREYDRCRLPEIYDQLRSGAQYCAHPPDSERSTTCNENWRAGMEWRGILRLRGITPR